MSHANNDKDHYSIKPLIFDEENFDYFKYRIESFFIVCDVYLRDMVIHGYTRSTYANGSKL